MKKIILCLAVIIFSAHMFAIEAPAQEVGKQELTNRMEYVSTHLRPSARQKVMQAAQQLETRVFSSSGRVDIYGMAISGVRGRFGNLPSSDIEALVAVVMFELVKSEDAALKEMLDEMNKMNQQKKKQRDYIEAMKKQKAAVKDKLKEKYVEHQTAQARVAPAKIARVPAATKRLNIKYVKAPVLPPFKNYRQMSVHELDTEINSAQGDLDSLNDMSQLDQLKLQETLQKEQQMIQTISNIMKKQQDTMKDIIGNMK